MNGLQKIYKKLGSIPRWLRLLAAAILLVAFIQWGTEQLTEEQHLTVAGFGIAVSILFSILEYFSGSNVKQKENEEE